MKRGARALHAPLERIVTFRPESKDYAGICRSAAVGRAKEHSVFAQNQTRLGLSPSLGLGGPAKLCSTASVHAPPGDAGGLSENIVPHWSTWQAEFVPLPPRLEVP